MAAQRIAVIGAGAVGGVLAAAAHAAGHEVTVCVRTPFDEFVIEDPDGSSELPVAIETDPQRLGPVDWVLLTTKVQDIASAEGWLRAADGPKTPVVAVQNGIEHHASLAPFGLRSPVLPALLYGGAERLRPGYVVRRSPISLVVPACELAERFAGLLSGPNVRTTEDFRSAAWRKLLTNLGANPISALTMRRLDMFSDPGTRELLRAVLSEAVAVARAEGAELDDGGALAAKVWDTVSAKHYAAEDARVQPYLPWNPEPVERTHRGPLPPLLKGYLRLGAQVCGRPAHDPEFGVADFFVLLDFTKIDQRYLRFFLGAAA